MNDEHAVLTLTRVFDAPRELVWNAWTEPERLAQWWGPKGFIMRTHKLELVSGGMYHYAMQSPAGQEMWGKLIYREIVAPERLVFVSSFSDQEGNTLRHPLSVTWPLQVLNTYTFTEHDGKTVITMRGEPINASELERETFACALQGVQGGMKGTLDQLDEYLAHTVKQNA